MKLELRHPVNVSALLQPGRVNVNEFFRSLHKRLQQDSSLSFCLADFDESFHNIDGAYKRFFSLNILEWADLKPKETCDYWTYYGEILHPLLENIGAVKHKQYISFSNIPYCQTLVNRIMETVIDVRTSFMAEIVETAPTLYPYIFGRELPDIHDCATICSDQFRDELGMSDGNPVKLILGVIAHEVNAQLWKLAPKYD